MEGQPTFNKENTGVYLIDLETGKYQSRILSERFNRLNLGQGTVYFTDLVRNLAQSELLDAADRQALLDFYPSDEAVSRLLRTKESLSTEFGVLSHEGLRLRCRLTLTKGLREGEAVCCSELLAGGIEGGRNTFNSFFLAPYYAAFYVDLATREYQIYKLTPALAAEYPHMADYISSLERYINKSVHPEDRQALLSFIQPEAVRRALQHQNEISLAFRDISNPDLRHYSLQFIRGEDENHAAAGFLNITEQRHREQERQEYLRQNLEIIGGLAGEYLALYYLNLQENNFIVFSIDENRLSDTKQLLTRQGDPFLLIHQFAHSPAVHPEDQALFDAITRQSVVERLSDSKRFSIRFRRNYGTGWLWSVMDVVKYEKIDQPANTVVIGFAEKDREIRRQMEAERNERAAELIRGITASYDTVYAVNMNDDTYQVLKHREVIAQNYGHTPFFSKGLARYIEGQVLPAEREMLKKQLDYGYIREKLSHAPSFRIEFRDQEGGTPCWYEMVISSISLETGEILIAAAQRDREILLRHIEEAMTGHFEGIYVADMNRNQMKILKGTGGFKQFEGKIIPQRETMHQFAKNLTGDDQIYFRDVYGNPPAVQKMLQKDPDTEYFYQSPNYGGGMVWMKSEVHVLTWDEKGIPETAMVGISPIDSSQREKMDMNAQIARQKAQLEEQRTRLEEALSMAQSASRAKTVFLNNMSHDIRTPMNAIIGFTGLAASHIDNKGLVQDYLGKISQSSSHLLSLINDVLDMSRIESGKVHLEEREESLSDIVHILRNMVQADVRARQLDFFVDVVDVKHENVVCDKLRLNQVLLNVLSNAIKYTNPGGTVSLKVTERAFTRPGYAAYAFIIKDTGIGMDEAFLKTIFDPFTRVQSTTVSGIQGTGLGMAITKNIVDMMGGQIDIQSVPDKGTTVTIAFEFRLHNHEESQAPIDGLQNLRALVADDDMDCCLSVSQMLQDICMRPEWCTSGREAVVRAKDAYSKGDPFRVYIIDWLMPDLNGIETVRCIRKEIGPDIPIVILTAYDWSDIEEEARKAGVTAFVSKPLFPSDLRRVLRSCVMEEQSAAAPAEKETDFTGKKILLVEDNELNLEIAQEMLTELGFLVDTAQDGTFAVEKLSAARAGDFDLVLMDIQMPLMNGYEATKKIRALGTEISRIPILAMTANAFAEDKQLALQSGMNDHIAKPIDIAGLIATLKKYLK